MDSSTNATHCAVKYDGVDGDGNKYIEKSSKVKESSKVKKHEKLQKSLVWKNQASWFLILG